MRPRDLDAPSPAARPPDGLPHAGGPARSPRRSRHRPPPVAASSRVERRLQGDGVQAPLTQGAQEEPGDLTGLEVGLAAVVEEDDVTTSEV